MEPVDTTNPSPTPEPQAEIALPTTVRARLEHLDTGVLVDTRALERVRERFDAEQAHTLGRYLTNAQSPATLRAYRADWTSFGAWCLAEQA